MQIIIRKKKSSIYRMFINNNKNIWLKYTNIIYSFLFV